MQVPRQTSLASASLSFAPPPEAVAPEQVPALCPLSLGYILDMGEPNPISSVGASDLPGVRSLIAAAIRGSVAESESDAEFLIADINETLDKWLHDPRDSVHLKYEVAGEILGVALVKNFWNLSTLFVAPARQRQGIGRALMAEVLRVCGPASPRGKVEVNSSRVAVPFYETQGFRRTGRTHVRPGGCFHMEHVFAPASQVG